MQKDIITVLHVVTYMGRGGLESMIMNYYRNIDRDRVQFDFLVHRDFRADYDDEIESLGGHIFRLSPLNPLSSSYKKSLEEFFKTHKYKIVHSHLDCMSAYPLKAAKKMGVPVRIAHAHSKSQDKDWKYPIKLYAKSKMPQYATELFACGKEAGEWMFSGKDFRVMNNAIDAEKYIYSEQTREQIRQELGIKDSFVVGHVGRFNYPKNHGFLVDVFASVLKIKPDSRLLLVGDGDGRAEIEKKVEELGLKDKVIFTGVRSDVNKLMQAMDIFAFPSIYEGLPVTMIEAQAAGLPCVMSENVPTECIITEGLVDVELLGNADKWAERLIEKSNSTKRTNTFDEIEKSGYEIKYAAKLLEEFYEGKCK